MPEDVAPTPPKLPAEGAPPGLTTEQVVGDAAAAAERIVASAESATGQPVAEAAAPASAVPTAETAPDAPGTVVAPTAPETGSQADTQAEPVVQPAAQGLAGGVSPEISNPTAPEPTTAPETPPASPFAPPVASESFATGEKDTSLPTATAVADETAKLTAEANAAGVATEPTESSMAALQAMAQEAKESGSDSPVSQPANKIMATNFIDQARANVAAATEPAPTTEVVDATDGQPSSGGEMPVASTDKQPEEPVLGNPALDAAMTEAYGNPDEHTTQGAAVAPPQPVAAPSQAEVFKAQDAANAAGASWPEIQTPAAGAAGSAQGSGSGS